MSTIHSPIATLGTVTLFLAFIVNAYTLVVSIAGQKRGRPGLVKSSIYASWAFAALMTVASALAIYAFLSHDFAIKYVAGYSDLSMPFFYKITAYWGGLDGSLMFWLWMLSLFAAVAIRVNQERHRDIIGYVVATIAAVSFFFLALLIYVKNPFATFMTEVPFDGKGLNPQLQTWAMVIHPPALYLGFVGMTIPFAFCIGALAAGRLDDLWLHSVRVWVIISWFFLSFGLVLGCIWAYEELGWGGYWAWDPVENAGLFPWFTATAFLHSVMIQERRGMLKVWNVILVILSFLLTIFGTFLTRSGVVQSVHAFGEDPQLALIFILFMAAILVISFGFVFYRLPSLKSSARLDSFFSREFVFLFNNWILLGSMFYVLFGTMLPTLSEMLVGERLTIGPAWFDKRMIPVGLVLLFLTGVGPLLAWRVTTRQKLFQQFLVPAITLALTLLGMVLISPRLLVLSPFIFDWLLLPNAFICFGLVAFTMATIGQEFWRGTRVRMRQTGASWLTSAIGVLVTKRRKYGGYVVHLGVALMFIGFAGKAFSIEHDYTLKGPGESFEHGGYVFRYDDFVSSSSEKYVEFGAKMTVLKQGKVVTTMQPAIRRYPKAQESTTEVAIDRGLDKDLYLILNHFEEDERATFRAVINPLVNWLWIGFGVLGIGVVICLLPEWLIRQLRPRGAAGALALLVTLGLSASGVVRADEPASGSRHVEAPAEEQLTGVPPVAIRLFERIVCLCGDCKRLTLKVCTCGMAAQERQTILGMLAGKDLSTTDKEKAAYDEVIRAYVDRFGGQHVLAVPLDTPFNWAAGLVPYVVLGAGLVLVFMMGRRWVSRSRPDQDRAQAQDSKAQSETRDPDLEEKLNDELRDID